VKIILAFLCLFGITVARADFLPQTDDIPLMEGLILKETDDVAFDTPAGQILVFEAQTKASPDAVRSFYAQSLTALGWSWKKKDTYVRGADTLEMSFPQAGIVRFDITLANR